MTAKSIPDWLVYFSQHFYNLGRPPTLGEYEEWISYGGPAMTPDQHVDWFVATHVTDYARKHRDPVFLAILDERHPE